MTEEDSVFLQQCCGQTLEADWTVLPVSSSEILFKGERERGIERGREKEREGWGREREDV